MSTATQEVATTWPETDFEKNFLRDFAKNLSRLVAELQSADRAAKALADKIAAAQQKADRTPGMSVAVILGGQEESNKLTAEQDTLHRAVIQKLEELRQCVNKSRAGFYARKQNARRRLQPGIDAAVTHTRKRLQEIAPALPGWFGAKDEIDSEEQQIREWNRSAMKLNRNIPDKNTLGIPRVEQISPDASLRGDLVQMIIADPILRDFLRWFLELDAKERQDKADREEFLAKQKEPPIF